MLPYDVSLKYMIVGYIVIFGVLLVYLVSLFVRWKNRLQEWKALHKIEEK
jgi:hypothetical protein